MGSCYIGDIMENYEQHRDMFGLPRYVFPIALVCFGYPTEKEKKRPLSSRYGKEFIVFRDSYKKLTEEDFSKMYGEQEEQFFGDKEDIQGLENLGQVLYFAKFNSDFSREMTRSVRAIIDHWKEV